MGGNEGQAMFLLIQLCVSAWSVAYPHNLTHVRV